MIFPDKHNPYNNLYVIGGNILSILLKKKKIINSLIHEEYCKIYPEVSYEYLILSLNFLFILDLIKLNGMYLELCD